MNGQHERLPINEVELDKENPRIRRFLEHYEEITDESIALALDVAADPGEDGSGAASPQRLKNLILASGGIQQPIIVNRQADGRLVCIEGNTRLWIYREFHRQGLEGDWSTIPALVHDGLAGFDIDAIRLQAHLVGPRAWDAYSKAKYQWELHYKHMMPIDRLVDLCGGDRRDVQKSIQAYADMESYFRKLHEPGEYYNTQRYSGFVELQSGRVKNAIVEAGFTLGHFGQWIKNGKIKGLADVRRLPQILPVKKARDVFIRDGIKSALDVLERPETSALLKEASIEQIARVLADKLVNMPFSEIRQYRADPENDIVRSAIEVHEALGNFLEEIDR